MQYSRRPDAKWFRYWATRSFCPNRGVELRAVVRPLSYVINLTIIAISVYVLFLVFHSSVFVRHGMLVLIGQGLLVVPLIACNAKWGFSYSVASAEPDFTGEQEDVAVDAGTQIRPLLRIASAVLVVLAAIAALRISQYPNQPWWAWLVLSAMIIPFIALFGYAAMVGRGPRWLR
ncbi:MAG: hypothetical protein ACYDE0_13930 [Acidiferrobacterales bacterium]